MPKKLMTQNKSRRALVMKLSLLIILCGFFFLSCAEQTARKAYNPIDSTACKSNIENKTADFNEPSIIDIKNAGDYKMSGTCKNENSEVKIHIEGYPLERPPLCNKGKWKISVDVTGIANKRESVQLAISQPGESGFLCINTTNYFVCPQGYIGVPELGPYTSSAFCVMKYEAKSSSKIGGSPFNRPLVKAEALAGGYLITQLSETDAIKSCKENGVAYDLINNDEWQTISRHIEMTDVNWSKGETKVQNGNRLNIGSTSVQKSSDDDNISDRWSFHKRTHKLPNNQYIWDFAGSLSELVQLLDIKHAPSYGDYVYKMNDSKLKNLFGPEKDYSVFDPRQRHTGFGGLGFVNTRRFKGGLIRGGGAMGSNIRTAGIFSADTTVDTKSSRGRLNTGFRCVYYP